MMTQTRSGRVGLTVAVALGLISCAVLEQVVPGAPLPVRSHEGITYRAETRQREGAPGRFETTAALSNTTTERRELVFPDGCVVLVRAYRNAARSGAPSWDQGRAVACTQALVRVELSAGATERRSTEFDVRQVLGDSLPEGRYFLTAYLRPENEIVEVTAGEVELRR